GAVEAPPTYLAGDRVRAAPRVGAGPARALGPDAHAAHRARAPLELGPLGDDVAERGERVAGLARDPPLDLHLAGGHRVRPERVGEATRGQARRLHRGLQLHAEDRDVEEDLEHRLLLDVAA